MLGIGEASTLLSFYLASKGALVYTIDLNPVLAANANHVASVMGWKLFNLFSDAVDIPFPERTFDHVLSICVLEHIERQEQAVAEMARVLKRGGILGLTFDYGYLAPECYGFLSPDEIETRIVKPSGLEVIGNRHFSESPWQEEGLHGAWGSLFLHKPAVQRRYDDVPWADKAKQSLIEQDIRQRLERFQRENERFSTAPQVESTPWWALPGKAWLYLRQGGPDYLWREVKTYFRWLWARRRQRAQDVGRTE